VTPAPVGDPAELIKRGKIVDSQIQFDLTYRVDLPRDVTLAATVQNLFDEDPPFARTEMSYDPMTHNPLGRTVQINVKKRF
jgi:iron complex outermembrane receptor protein